MCTWKWLPSLEIYIYIYIYCLTPIVPILNGNYAIGGDVVTLWHFGLNGRTLFDHCRAIVQIRSTANDVWNGRGRRLGNRSRLKPRNVQFPNHVAFVRRAEEAAMRIYEVRSFSPSDCIVTCRECLWTSWLIVVCDYQLPHAVIGNPMAAQIV